MHQMPQRSHLCSVGFSFSPLLSLYLNLNLSPLALQHGVFFFSFFFFRTQLLLCKGYKKGTDTLSPYLSRLASPLSSSPHHPVALWDSGLVKPEEMLLPKWLWQWNRQAAHQLSPPPPLTKSPPTPPAPPHPSSPTLFSDPDLRSLIRLCGTRS